MGLNWLRCLGRAARGARTLAKRKPAFYTVKSRLVPALTFLQLGFLCVAVVLVPAPDARTEQGRLRPCSLDEELAPLVDAYIQHLVQGEWEQVYALRCPRFRHLYPPTTFLAKISSLQYRVHSYDVLNCAIYGRSARLIVRVVHTLSPEAAGSYGVAWWGKGTNGWVCIDDGTYLFPFVGGLCEAELSQFLNSSNRTNLGAASIPSMPGRAGADN